MEKRRYHVMQVAQGLFLKKGFVQTSIQDIINAAEISKGTFYNYFDSKNDCLIAILKYAQKEASKRRKQLLSGEKINDRLIFAKQIAIRMQVNREQNLLPLFGFVFHSKDQELREFAKTYHLEEIAWLSERFINVYGEAVYRFAVDGAIIILGLTQQYSLAWSSYVKKEVDTKQLIMFILRNMDAVAENYVRENKSFIDDEMFIQVEAIWERTVEEDELLLACKELKKTVLKTDEIGLEYLQFMIDEVKSAHPRMHLLTSIGDLLRKRYAKNEHANKINNLMKEILEEVL